MFRIYLQHFPCVFLMYNTTSCLHSPYCITEHQNTFHQYRWNSVTLRNLSSSCISSYSCLSSVLVSISMIATFWCCKWGPAIFALLCQLYFTALQFHPHCHKWQNSIIFVIVWHSAASVCHVYFKSVHQVIKHLDWFYTMIVDWVCFAQRSHISFSV